MFIVGIWTVLPRWSRISAKCEWLCAKSLTRWILLMESWVVSSGQEVARLSSRPRWCAMRTSTRWLLFLLHVLFFGLLGRARTTIDLCQFTAIYPLNPIKSYTNNLFIDHFNWQFKGDRAQLALLPVQVLHSIFNFIFHAFFFCSTDNNFLLWR